MTWIAIALMVAGLFFLVVGAVGMLRLPDVFARSHALSLTDLSCPPRLHSRRSLAGGRSPRSARRQITSHSPSRPPRSAPATSW